MHDRLLCRLYSGYKVALVVPDDEVLHSDLLTMHHNSPLAVHLGLYCMMHALAEHYCWKGMYHECQYHARACKVC